MKREVRQVGVHEDLRIYARDLIEETRTRSEVRFGASPRALLELLRASQACVYLEDGITACRRISAGCAASHCRTD